MMRPGPALLLLFAACGGGGNDVDPRVIPGGGVGDGAIDGEVNVYVVDAETEAPITTASVQVGEVVTTVDSSGLAVFTEVEGPQTFVAKAAGYRSVVWVGADGANVTLALAATAPSVGQATLSGTIAGFDALAVPAGHSKVAVALYSQSDRLGDDANNLATPNNANICSGATTCSWSLRTRAGALHVVAALVDYDANGTPATDDDILEVIGWASAAVTVVDGVNQSGIVLAPIEAGNLTTATVDLGSPPAALAEHAALVGIELGDDEVVQLPFSFLSADGAGMLAPALAAFPGATYRLTAIAQTTAGDDGAQSIVLRRGLAAPDLAAGAWLAPPTGVEVTRTSATWTPVAGALFHQVSWTDASDPSGDILLDVTMFDPAATSASVPALVALPATGALHGRVAALAASLDPTNFSLDADRDKLTGLAGEPVELP